MKAHAFGVQDNSWHNCRQMTAVRLKAWAAEMDRLEDESELEAGLPNGSYHSKQFSMSAVYTCAHLYLRPQRSTELLLVRIIKL